MAQTEGTGIFLSIASFTVRLCTGEDNIKTEARSRQVTHQRAHRGQGLRASETTGSQGSLVGVSACLPGWPCSCCAGQGEEMEVH